jgi:polysaccharide biosynthesis transport protein
MARDPLAERLRNKHEPPAVRHRRIFSSLYALQPISGRVGVNLHELFEVVWRRKLTVVAVTLLVIGLAVGLLRTLTPQYESTATLALIPTGGRDDVFLLTVLDAVTPVYADAAVSRNTENAARARAGGELGKISVRTFNNSPIIRIKARHSDRAVAQRSAQAVTDVLLERSTSGARIPNLVLRQIDRANRPTDPVFPQTTLTLGAAILLGLSAGLAVALLRENLTTTIETPEELARLSGVPVFGEIPNVRRLSRVSSPDELVSDPRLRIASEALRDLRTNLLFANGTLSSIAVTSPEGSHGKTTVSFGLAAVLARSGARTLLIDADLRRGRLAELLKVEQEPGLGEVLLGLPLADAIRPSAVTSFDFLARGRLGTDPGELLMYEFGTILEECERRYEVVVVDTTPLVPISDARMIARYAKATLIVASAGVTTRRQMRTAVERLQLISVRPTAVVLNNYRSPVQTAYYGMTPSRNGQEDRRGKRRARSGFRRRPSRR